MALKVWEFISILLSATTAGMFVGPWLALTRSFRTFEPEPFLAVTRRLNENMSAVMTPLMPVSLLSIVPVLVLSYGAQPALFFLNLLGLALFITALLVTMLVEVPKVLQMVSWSASALPGNWQEVRDSWVSFHIVRVVASLVGLALLLAGAIFLTP